MSRSVSVMASIGSFLALVSHYPSCFAQGLDPSKPLNQFQFENWNTDDGLPQNSVIAIEQTNDGYLWLGTYSGLARFDGISFRTFDMSTIPGLQENATVGFCEDSHGYLWVAFRGGGVGRFSEGLPERIWTTEDGLFSNIVWDIAEDHRGTIWIATDKGLSQFQDGRFAPAFGCDELVGHPIRTLLVDNQNTLWVGTGDMGLVRLRGGHLTRFTGAHGLSDNRIRSLSEGSGGTLWIGTDHGLNAFQEDTFAAYTVADGLLGNEVRALRLDHDGSLWIGTYGPSGGVTRLHDGVFASFTLADGLTNSYVRSLHEDREGSLWFGTNHGLNRLKQGKFTTFTTRDGLGSDFVRAVIEDSAGNIWVGTDFGGITRITNGQFTTLDRTRGLLGNSARSFATEPDGTVWVGVYGGGLNRINGTVISAFAMADGLSSHLIRALFVDRTGSLWIGTEDAGLNRYVADHIEVFSTQEGLLGPDVDVILEDRAGSLWVGSASGLHLLQGDRFRRFTTRDGLPHNRIFSLYEDAEECLWIGSERGLSRRMAGTFQHFGRKHGLAERAVFQILEDNAGYLWLSTNSGIFRVLRKDLSRVADGIAETVNVDRYGTADGMITAQCNGTTQPAGWRDRDGRLWFPTARGVAVIDPMSIRINEVPPLVAIEDFVVDGRSASTRHGEAVDVPAGAKRFEIRYSGLSLMAPEMMRFQFKLEGNDPTWVSAGTRRTAYYTNLKPGPYSFAVHAANNDGVWSESAATLAFTVLPFFYETWWFYLAVSVCILGLVSGIVSWRSQQLRRRTTELEEQVATRTAGLRSYAAELETLDRIVQVINSRFELEALLESLLEQGLVLFPHAEKAIALVRDPLGDMLRVAAAAGWALDAPERVSYSVGEILSKYTEGSEREDEGGYLLRSVESFDKASGTKPTGAPKSVLAMDVTMHDRLEAFFVFESYSDEATFDRSDLRKLSRFRRHAVSAIMKARTFQQLEEANQQLSETSNQLTDANRELQRLSSRDGLTSVANRRYFDEMFAREWQRALRMGTETSLLMIDIDEFKKFNDAYGHQRGDDCLKAVASVLENRVSRSSDFVARYGGEEFVVLLPATSLDGATAIAERLRHGVEALGLRHEQSSVAEGLTISIGVATSSRQGGASPADLLSAADRALYFAKQAGRNRVSQAS